jgi:hypothetical protein
MTGNVIFFFDFLYLDLWDIGVGREMDGGFYAFDVFWLYTSYTLFSC